MKYFTVLLAMSFVAFNASANQTIEKNYSSQRAEVLRDFLKEANNKKSKIGSVIEKVRQEKMTGFNSEPDGVVAQKLTKSDLSIVLTNAYDYIGTIRGGADDDSGEIVLNYKIYVLATEVVYGGRITSHDAIVFDCEYKDTNYNQIANSITCVEEKTTSENK